MRYRFSGCVLDVERHEFMRDGTEQSVEPQVFDLISLLVREPGKLVTQDRIIDEIWDGRIVSDSAISSRINAARKAVGDNGKDQRIIKTVPRRGFQIVVPVDIEANAKDDAELRNEKPVQSRQAVRFVKSADGTSLAYAVSGNGPKVLRAGHFMTHLERDWNSPIWRPYLEALGERHTIIRYDQRGTGLSAQKLLKTDVEDYSDDLKAVADAAGLEKFPLIASSQGVPAAIHFAAHNPERVTKLILYGGYALGRVLRDGGDGADQTKAMLSMIRAGWGKADSGFMIGFTSLFCPAASNEEIVGLAEIQAASTSPENAAKIRDAIDRFDVTDLLDKVRAPTLVIHSQDDSVHPVSQGQLLAQNIADAEFIQVASTNHILMPSHPTFDEVIQAHLDFLSD